MGTPFFFFFLLASFYGEILPAFPVDPPIRCHRCSRFSLKASAFQTLIFQSDPVTPVSPNCKRWRFDQGCTYGVPSPSPRTQRSGISLALVEASCAPSSTAITWLLSSMACCLSLVSLVSCVSEPWPGRNFRRIALYLPLPPPLSSILEPLLVSLPTPPPPMR